MKKFYYFLSCLFILSCSESTKKNVKEKTERLNRPIEKIKDIQIEDDSIFNELKPFEKVALEFINDYTENCNKMNKSIRVVEWVNTNPYSSSLLKSELNRIMENAEKENPGYGLGFDPIFNAQDFPDSGFELVTSDSVRRIVTVKDKILDGFEMKIKLINVNRNWLVNGIGIINLPSDEASQQNSIKASKNYKWVKNFNSKGEGIGELYIKPLNDTIFESLRIINKKDTIYKIDKLDFWNKEGKDFDIPKDTFNFYGYSFLQLNDNSFILNYYMKKGKNVADNIMIKWNESEGFFKVMIAP